jgi:hypothetical protein
MGDDQTSNSSISHSASGAEPKIIQGKGAGAASNRATPPEAQLAPILINLPPENVVYLKFITESYEGVGIIRTLEPTVAKVAVLATESTRSTALELLKSIADSLQIQILEPPTDLEEESLLDDPDNS